jgi:hypothetical protein
MRDEEQQGEDDGSGESDRQEERHGHARRRHKVGETGIHDKTSRELDNKEEETERTTRERQRIKEKEKENNEREIHKSEEYPFEQKSVRRWIQSV